MPANKILTVAALFLAAAAMQLAAQSHAKTGPASAAAPAEHGIRCLAADNTPCTAAQVQDLNQSIVTGRRMYQPLATVRSVSLGGPDGTLTCLQISGAPCTDDQTNALKNYAAQQKKKGGGIHIVRTIDMASP